MESTTAVRSFRSSMMMSHVSRHPTGGSIDTGAGDAARDDLALALILPLEGDVAVSAEAGVFTAVGDALLLLRVLLSIGVLTAAITPAEGVLTSDAILTTVLSTCWLALRVLFLGVGASGEKSPIESGVVAEAAADVRESRSVRERAGRRSAARSELARNWSRAEAGDRASSASCAAAESDRMLAPLSLALPTPTPRFGALRLARQNEGWLHRFIDS
eukprot:scaffold301173_cov32-Tisochrysis_lutea.AAC.1